MKINHKIGLHFIVRNATNDDVDKILALDNKVWKDFPADREMIASRINVFPEGNLVAVYKSEIVGYLCLQFNDYDLEKHPPFTWNEITDKGTLIKTHDMQGQFMYGAAMTVAPEVQNFGIGTRLIFAGWSLIVKYDKRGCMIGSRIPGYSSVKDKYTPEDYIKLQREDGKLFDPELRLYKSDGFTIISVLPNYEPDPESCDYGVLVYQANPFYNRGCLGLRKLIAFIIAKWGHKILGV
ncbi:hypothetical protein JW977_01155 [Candidatus Falkowbacteria bacterium]|nr:hypothetical protein [Candidatus Falkowbacteria bacterium]